MQRKKHQLSAKCHFFLKIKKTVLKMVKIFQKDQKLPFGDNIFFFSSEIVLCRELRCFALHSVHQNPSFKLSKLTFRQFFQFVILIGDPYEFWVVKKFTEFEVPKKNLKHLTKWIRNMGGRSFIITSCAFGGTLLNCCSPSCNILNFSLHSYLMCCTLQYIALH